MVVNNDTDMQYPEYRGYATGLGCSNIVVIAISSFRKCIG